MNIVVPKCEVCKRDCTPIPCSHKLDSSEWYCSVCHKSIKMDAETAKGILMIEARSRAK